MAGFHLLPFSQEHGGPVAGTARLILVALAALSLNAPSVTAGDDLPERLRQTMVINMDEIIAGQFAGATPRKGFGVGDPYGAPTGEAAPGSAGAGQTVQRWLDGTRLTQQACAVRFTGPERRHYELVTLSSAAEAGTEGAIVTHFGRCGTCSPLRDLAVYLERPDLTTLARRCARKWGAQSVKRCFVERVGFSEACAESWTYNALHTRRHCRAACVETYGLLNLLLHRYPAPNNLDDGSLNACLQCDEDESGPGFQYSAGRTRRNSGIRSAIDRPSSEIRPVDHAHYFDD